MSAWVNFVAYQLVWFAVVMSAGHGRSWIGVIAAVAFIIGQLALSTRRLLDLQLMAAAFALGMLIDGGLSFLGSLSFASASPALPPGGAPIWILALWVSFALTLPRSLAWIVRRPLLGMLLGAIGAPLAYLSAARGWDAVAFAVPKARSVAALAAGWAVAIPILSYVARRGSADLTSAAHALKVGIR